MRTTMHWKFRVSSAISVCERLVFSTVAVPQWVRRWNSGHRIVQAEGSSPGGDILLPIFFEQ